MWLQLQQITDNSKMTRILAVMLLCKYKKSIIRKYPWNRRLQVAVQNIFNFFNKHDFHPDI